MRIRITLALAAVMAIAISLPLPAAAAVLVVADGGGDMSVGSVSSQPTTTPDPGSQDSDGSVVAQSNYAYSMYRAHTHSVQKTDWYCVPASIQMMLNLINGWSDGGKANQTKYWQYAQEHSRYPITDNGADAAGWAAALRHWGGGNYWVGIHTSMQASLQAAAKRMRLTGKPVGMLVWGHHGGHAWVMTGFKSSADPKFTNSFTVSSVQAMGPLWPYGTIDGKAFDPGPREWLDYTTLRNKFTDMVQHNAPEWDGRWLTVLP